MIMDAIPRKEGDAGLYGYDPRSMVYRTGDRNPVNEEILKDIAQKIKFIIKKPENTPGYSRYSCKISLFF